MPFPVSEKVCLGGKIDFPGETISYISVIAGEGVANLHQTNPTSWLKCDRGSVLSR